MMRGSQVSQTSQTQTVQVAPQVDRSGAVLLLGGTLLFVNIVFGPGGPTLVGYLDGRVTSPPAKGTIPWYSYLFALLALFLLVLLSKTGEVGGNLAVILLVAMWIVWLLNKPSEIGRILGQASQPGPPQVNEPNGNKKA